MSLQLFLHVSLEKVLKSKKFASGKPMTETLIQPHVPHPFVQCRGEGIAVQPTEEKGRSPKSDSMDG